MSGRSCATTGSRTGSLHLTTTSSAIAATPGTSSSISPGASCPSACANGPTGSDQWDLVLEGAATGGSMPRFYFDVRDNDRLTRDEDGTELSGVDAARTEASRTLGEMA